MVIATISDKKRISAIVDYLTKKIPLGDSFVHLKRINTRASTSRLILLQADENGDESARIAHTLEPFGEELQQFLKENSLCDLQIQEVPATRPLNRQQFENASTFWPVHFYEDKQYVNC